MNSSLKPLKISLLGFGNVGQGVFQILQENQAIIQNRIGRHIDLVSILVRDLDKVSGLDVGEAQFVTEYDKILADESVDVVVELMGGETPAFDYISQALSHKKHVVTANKEVMAKHKGHFYELAKKNEVDILFEAAVGGGIPLIRSLKVGYAANQIQSLVGILNGTTNYILTKIEQDQISFEQGVKNAQELGFAEADPSMDLSGLDAAYKLVILADVAFKTDIKLTDIYYEGIESITLQDIQYAKELGYVIKLLAIGQRSETDGLIFSVVPTFVSLDHPIASVNNEYNAVFINGNQVGESMLMGKGAGALPTASAVVSDLIDIGFDQGHSSAGSYRHLDWGAAPSKVLSFDDTHSSFYLRLILDNKPGVLATIGEGFQTQGVNVKTFIQKESEGDSAVVVVVTETVKESLMISTLAVLKEMSVVQDIPSIIRVGL